MFFVITSVIWSKLQEEHNQDNSNIFLYLIVWGWYLDAGVYSQQLKIIKRILENSQIIAWGIFSISVKMGVINTELIRIDSTFSWIVLSLITDSILSRTSFWKDGGQVVAFGMRCSAIGVVCTCIFDLNNNNYTYSDEKIVNLNTLPFWMIVNTVVYTYWFYYGIVIKNRDKMRKEMLDSPMQ